MEGITDGATAVSVATGVDRRWVRVRGAPEEMEPAPRVRENYPDLGRELVECSRWRRWWSQGWGVNEGRLEGAWVQREWRVSGQAWRKAWS